MNSEVFLDEKIQGMELSTQHIVMSRDLNQHGFLFGGQMLAWIDEGCAMFVIEKIGYSNLVTVTMDNVIFKSPGLLGEIIQIFSKIEKVGKSSITIRSAAIAKNQKKKEIREIIDCRVTYVCLDDSGKPFPYFSQFDPEEFLKR
ncbi:MULTISPECIES: acyl-CoA thioesterase [Leptospira]|uniref:Acyl-CoA thioesterase n=3 Tax=Leptospira TaxID=171 RepID=A0A5F2C3N6_9LEPT|nr:MULTISPECIES: hotdog domain-containing protein [Leptospira]PJZ49541.1 acyl-CoA thioesterase [Leptospira saintgironsiae]PKA14773.1 acyl-CoA thioesterase [Leptospira haakeii]PKA19527.1 acyl-CoA thioesterase [Leptospira haakeii]TGM11282.1 acyl-CoA thioesterase [Leptospira selangorensis]TGM22966.1 acyl-CoA thioesterase [Leptospira selangorensis]